MTDPSPAPAQGDAPGGAAGTQDAAPAPDAGQVLAAAREAAGLSVADVALQLKFAPRQIEAMEAGRFEDLPAGTFARGMARSYARLVKVDPAPLLAQIASRTLPPDTSHAVALQPTIPITDSARRTNVIYAGLSVALLVVIAGVVFEWQREQGKAEEMTFVSPSAALAPATPAGPAGIAVTPSTTPLESPPPPADPVAKPEPQAAPSSSVPAVKEPARADGSRALRLRFDRDAWVQVRGRGGKLLLSELNRAGTERVVEGTPPFDLVIGNAQHVRLTYGDRPVDLTPHVKVEVARFTLD